MPQTRQAYPIVALIVLAVAQAAVAQATQAAAPATQVTQRSITFRRQPFKEEMRTPFDRHYIRQWLVCGPFVAPPQPGGKPAEPGQGPDVDYLAAAGGEAAARPVAGMQVKRPDGTVAAWSAAQADSLVFDFTMAYPQCIGQFNVAAYAYATIERAEAGKAVISLGTYNKSKVYINGKLVYEKTKLGGGPTDPPTVTVDLRQGKNDVLVKMESLTWFWGFTFRVVDQTELEADPSRMAEVVFEHASKAGTINPTLKTIPMPSVRSFDTGSGKLMLGCDKVAYEVVAPGGKVVAESRGHNPGDIVQFDVGPLPEGPLEFRVSTLWPDGRRVYTHVPWYNGFKGRLTDDLCRMLNECDALPAESNDPTVLCKKLLAQLVLDRLKSDPRKATAASGTATSGEANSVDPQVLKDVLGALMEYHELLMNDPARNCWMPECAADNARARSQGFYRLAWRDEIDNSPQYASVHLPPGYTKDKKWPLMVSLHGYRTDPNHIAYGIGRHNGVAEDNGVIFLEPRGRGNVSYKGLGEQDVLRAVRMTVEKFGVDEDRIYLRGESMGGSGAWRIGTRHPDIFAAVCPVFGGEDYHTKLTDENARLLTPRQRFAMEAASTFAQAEALLTTPVFMNHGELDIVVPTDASRYAARLLERWGYNVRYWEHPAKGHETLGEASVTAAWCLQYRLDRSPRHVRLRAAELKSAAAHWVRIEQRMQQYAFMLADAVALDPQTIRLDTENAVQVRLSPPEAIISRKQPVRIIWNGQDWGEQDFASGVVTLKAKGYAPGPLTKTAAVEGPMGEVYNTPFAIVEGTTSADPAMRTQCQRLANEAVESWKRRHQISPRRFTDTEITPADLARYSLIWIGGPADNAVTKQLAGKLPLKIEADKVFIAGGELNARDAAVAMIYPSPLAAGRYVQVLAAASPQAMARLKLASRGAGRGRGNSAIPENMDFCVTAGDGKPAVAGLFDSNWQMRPELTNAVEAAPAEDE